jgi:hypothetical protein
MTCAEFKKIIARVRDWVNSTRGEFPSTAPEALEMHEHQKNCLECRRAGQALHFMAEMKMLIGSFRQGGQ